MTLYEEKLKKIMKENNVPGEHLTFKESCHSVEDAAAASLTNPDEFVKNICMIDMQGHLIVAIVKGEDRASTSRVAAALGIEQPRLAIPAEILEKTGYPCGGTPSFGYAATFLMDPRVMEKEVVYSGGGSDHSLVKMTPKHMQEINHAAIMRVRK
ncbi:hypothetical protein HZB01_00315 [Candidatus Woesearchaeota archaeon]|nr:hypothetical protein [Candidatus Woesearchaeota archaeon]